MRLLDNPLSMRLDAPSLRAAMPCPRAMAWMATFAVASGRRVVAERWLIELYAAVVFNRAAGSHTSQAS